MFEFMQSNESLLDDRASALPAESNFVQSVHLPVESSMNLNNFITDRDCSADYGTCANPKTFHHAFISTYKVFECEIDQYHDKRQCKFWHSSGDRRRNPLETPYSPIECPHALTSNCPDGDSCLLAHNMMERMFHPELYKISMCTRGPNGTLCERGDLCAFAHFPAELRTPPSRVTGTLHIRESKEIVRDRLIQLIKSAGAEGILSSELPKRYSETYGKKLEIVDELGNRCRIKNVLIHKNIAMMMHKNVQPKYVYVEESNENAFATSPANRSRSFLDDTHHTIDSLDITNHPMEVNASQWRRKYETLLQKHEEVQRSNKQMYQWYHSMRKDLMSVLDIIRDKSKKIEELRTLLNSVQSQSMAVQQQVQLEQMQHFHRQQQQLLTDRQAGTSVSTAAVQPVQPFFSPGMWSSPSEFSADKFMSDADYSK